MEPPVRVTLPDRVIEVHEGCHLEKGWQPIIHHAVARIIAISEGRVEFLRIKEKFGGLRIYLSAPDLDEDHESAIHDIADMAEGESLTTCELCGAPGSRADSEGNWRAVFNWVRTLCNTHYKEAVAKVENMKNNAH